MIAVIAVQQKHLQLPKKFFTVIEITSIYDSIQSLVSTTGFLYNLSWGQTGSIMLNLLPSWQLEKESQTCFHEDAPHSIAPIHFIGLHHNAIFV